MVRPVPMMILRRRGATFFAQENVTESLLD